MKRWLQCAGLVAFFVLGFAFRSPAPLYFRPGEGWIYEPAGGEGNWVRDRAKDQLEVAQAAFDKKDIGLAERAAHRVIKVWPLSDYAPPAVYLLARCLEEDKKDELAFKQYQILLEKYPKAINYDEVLQRQFTICNRFLAGERFKLWGFLPTFPSMDKTVEMYEKLIKSGPYSPVAPQAQLNIGAAHEKRLRLANDNQPYLQAAKAYEVAADRYHYEPKIAAEALFREGLAYEKQARTAEYDQGTAGQAIDTFSDFIQMYPDDPRISQAEKIIVSLKLEQAHGNYQTAKYYESRRQWMGARIYYNEVVSKDPGSPYAAPSLQRITELNKLIGNSSR